MGYGYWLFETDMIEYNIYTCIFSLYIYIYVCVWAGGLYVCHVMGYMLVCTGVYLCLCVSVCMFVCIRVCLCASLSVLDDIS